MNTFMILWTTLIVVDVVFYICAKDEDRLQFPWWIRYSPTGGIITYIYSKTK